MEWELYKFGYQVACALVHRTKWSDDVHAESLARASSLIYVREKCCNCIGL